MSTTDNFKKVRLFRVSRELNIAVDSLVEHLSDAGFADALSGKGINASITNEDAYLALLEEFAEDKAMAARIDKKRAARVVSETGEIVEKEISEEEAVVEETKSEEVTSFEDEFVETPMAEVVQEDVQEETEGAVSE